jgi:hypothetical protein
MNTYLITGYANTGTYTEVVRAEDSVEAMKKGKAIMQQKEPEAKFKIWHVGKP